MTGLRVGKWRIEAKHWCRAQHAMPLPEKGLRRGLFEADEDDFGAGADAHRWAPRARAAGRIDEKIAEALESVDERAVDARGKPREREELAGVRVPRKLQADFFLGGDWQGARLVSEQDAGAIRVEMGVAEDRAEMLGVHRVAMVHADKLQTVDDNFFVVQHAHAGIADGFEVLRLIAELLVVPGNKVGAERRRELFERRGEVTSVGGGTVVEVAADQDDVRRETRQHGDEALREAMAADVAEVCVRDQSGDAPAPGCRQVREFHGNLR